jgi:hypothetical protein
LVVIGCLTAFGAIGCGSDAAPTTTPGSTAPATTVGTSPPPSSGGASTTPATTPTTTVAVVPTGTDEEQIRATIDTYWKEWLKARNPPDPASAALLAQVTGPQRDREIRSLQKMAALGQAGRLPPDPSFRHDIVSVAVTGESAVAMECVVDDVVLFDVETGNALNDEVVTYVFRTTLVRTDGRWLINDSRTQREEPGVKECTLA